MRRFAAVCSLSLAFVAVTTASAPARAADHMPTRVQTSTGPLVLATNAWQRDTGISAVEVGLYAGSRLAHRSDFAAVPGAKRLRLVPLRALSADQIGRMLVRDMAAAGTKAEAASHVSSLVTLGQAFALLSKPLAAGDSLGIEFVPGQGVRALINDTPASAFMGDAQFFALVSRAWVGDAAEERGALKVAQR
jgi:Chalcone isomerase-like